MIKHLLPIAFFALMISSCEDRVYNYYQEVEQEESVERPEFTGYFNLDGPSDANCIFLQEKAENVVDIESDCQSLVSINPENGTLGQFPRITARNLLVQNGEIRFTKNINFSSSTHDIEEDDSGNDINGKKRVDVKILFVDSRLQLSIKVFKNANNSNLNEIVVERVFNEL